MVPRKRKGKLLKATLPELSAWGRDHPEAQKVSSGTVNKQLGAVTGTQQRGPALIGGDTNELPSRALWRVLLMGNVEAAESGPLACA